MTGRGGQCEVEVGNELVTEIEADATDPLGRVGHVIVESIYDFITNLGGAVWSDVEWAVPFLGTTTVLGLGLRSKKNKQ